MGKWCNVTQVMGIPVDFEFREQAEREVHGQGTAACDQVTSCGRSAKASNSGLVVGTRGGDTGIPAAGIPNVGQPLKSRSPPPP